MTTRSAFALIPSLILVLGTVSPAAAQRGPCGDDIKKFCADVQRGGGKLLQCLTQNESELTTDCKAHVEEMKGKGRGIAGRRRGLRLPAMKACREEITKFCSDVKRSDIANCLTGHTADLSPQCKAALTN